MAQFIDSAAQNKPRELDAILRFVNPEDTPVLSMLKGGTTLRGTKFEPSITAYTTASYAPVYEGAPVNLTTDINSTNPQTLPALAQTWRYSVGVSNVAHVIETATEKKGAELARQVAIGYVNLKRGIEATALSNQEQSVDNPGTTPMATRGLFQWTQAGNQTTFPVPSAFQPTSAQQYGSVATPSTLAGFTDAQLKSLVGAVFKATEGQAKKLDFIVGNDLQQVIDNFTQQVPVATGSQSVKRYDAGDPREYLNVVNRLVLSGATLDVHQSTRILTTSAGVATAMTHKSGIALDFDMYSVEYNKAPTEEELAFTGGGKQVLIEAIGMISSKNPLGSIQVVCNA